MTISKYQDYKSVGPKNNNYKSIKKNIKSIPRHSLRNPKIEKNKLMFMDSFYLWVTNMRILMHVNMATY